MLRFVWTSLWVNEETGELLTGYVPTEKDLELLSKIVR